MPKLKQQVIDKIEQLGDKPASEFFGVSVGTIKNWSKGVTSPSIDALELVIASEATEETGLPESGCDDIIPDLHSNLAEPLVTWEGKNVIVMQPVYRTINPDTHFTLFANYLKYGLDKIGLIQEHRTVIYESRNIMAHKFLKTDAEWAITVDDDMVLPPGNAALYNGKYKAGLPAEVAGRLAFSRLMSHPADKLIVGCLYFGRHELGKAQCCIAFESDAENKKLRAGHYTGLVPTDWTGTGLLRIHRSVFERMAKEIDNGRWPTDAPVGKGGDGGWYGFFTPMRVRMGEDVSFGRKAKEIGIQSYVDAGLVCLHVGDTRFGPRNTTG